MDCNPPAKWEPGDLHCCDDASVMSAAAHRAFPRSLRGVQPSRRGARGGGVEGGWMLAQRWLCMHV